MWRKICKLTMVATGIFALVLTPTDAQIGQYPTSAIKLIVPMPPGGATDLIGRIVAQHLGKDLNQTIIVENRPGAGGNIGMSTVVKSLPDGLTLLLGSTDTIVTNTYLYKNLPFNPLSDLAPVALVADAPEFIVVSASLHANDLRAFIEQARTNSNSFNYGSPGIGSIPYFAGDHLAQMSGTKMTSVPFRGSAPALIAVAAGDIQFTISTKASADSLVKSGKVKFLAIASPRRLDSLPDVPTTAEAGLPGFEFHDWFGVFAPRATSPDIVAQLNASLQKMFDDPATLTLFTNLGFLPMRYTVQESVDRIRQDSQYWKETISKSGIQLE